MTSRPSRSVCRRRMEPAPSRRAKGWWSSSSCTATLPWTADPSREASQTSLIRRSAAPGRPPGPRGPRWSIPWRSMSSGTSSASIRTLARAVSFTAAIPALQVGTRVRFGDAHGLGPSHGLVQAGAPLHLAEHDVGGGVQHAVESQDPVCPAGSAFPGLKMGAPSITVASCRNRTPLVRARDWSSRQAQADGSLVGAHGHGGPGGGPPARGRWRVSPRPAMLRGESSTRDVRSPGSATASSVSRDSGKTAVGPVGLEEGAGRDSLRDRPAPVAPQWSRRRWRRPAPQVQGRPHGPPGSPPAAGRRFPKPARRMRKGRHGLILARRAATPSRSLWTSASEVYIEMPARTRPPLSFSPSTSMARAA